MKAKFVTVLMISSLACQPQDEIPLGGEHIVLSADPGLQLCGGSLDFMDDFVASLSEEFSLTSPVGAERIRFHWIAPQEFDQRSGCPKGALGCAPSPHETFARNAPLNHELVHNVAAVFGRPPAFFVEGLAVAFEGLGEQPQSLNIGGNSDVRTALMATGAELVAADLYPLAGAFTAFLISRHGLDQYLRLYSELSPRADDDEIDAAFRELFGSTLEQALEDFAAEPFPCSHDAYDLKLLECDAPALAWDGWALEVSRTLSCDDPDAVGPFGEGSAVVFHTLDIDEPGLYQLRFVGDQEDFHFGPPQRVSMHLCAAGCRSQSFVAGARQPAQIGWLEAGRYALRLHGQADVPAPIGFQLRRID